MLVAYDESLTRHLDGVPHPEQPDRVRACATELARRGLFDERVDVRAAREDEVALVHAPWYIERAKRECAALAPGAVASLSTGDTDIDRTSFDGALRATGAALVALDHVRNHDTAGFALVRPPGHHAEPARGMGFCLFNSASIAARVYTREAGRPALIADIDYHHGNGTQALVDAQLAYASTHATPAYPGTGSARDNRVGASGTLANVPLPVRGVSTEAFFAIWAQTLRALVRRVRPGLLVISAGYDFAAGDPVGDLGVDPGIARDLGRLVREVADEGCDGRALFVLEGGYDPATLARCVAETIEGFEEARPAADADPRAIPPVQRAVVDEFAA